MMMATVAMALTANAQQTVDSYQKWDFSDFRTAEGSTQETVIISELTNYNGLYLRALSEGHAIKLGNNGSALTWNFSNFSAYTAAKNASMSATLGSGKSAIDDVMSIENPWDAVTSSTEYSLALKTTVPGTLYVAFRANANAADRYIKLTFNNEIVQSVAETEIYGDGTTYPNRQYVFEYTASEGGVFHFGGGGSIVYFVKFVPTGTKDPDGNTVVSDSKVWNFSQYAGMTYVDGETEKVGTLVSELTDYDGLYIRALSNRTCPINQSGSTFTWNLSDGTTYTAAKNEAMYISLGNMNSAEDVAIGLTYPWDAISSSANAYGLALKTSVAGKLYIAFRGNANQESRFHKLCFNNEIVKQQKASELYDEETYPGRATVFEYEAAEGGTFNFCGANSQVFLVEFVAEGTNGIQTIDTTPAKTDGNWYNLSGQRVAQPTKGLFIQNGKKYVIK